MKNIPTKIFIAVGLVIILSVFLMGFKRVYTEPQVLFRVYLDGKVIGTIESKSKLENYIDEKQQAIKETYDVDKVFAPNNFEIKRVFTYQKNVDNEEDIYNKIASLKSFTIRGYRVTLKNGEEKATFYVLDMKIVDEALEKAIKAYVAETDYENYENESQEPIKDFGKIIEGIYIDDDTSYSEYNIPVTETIYTKSDDLVRFLLFGEEPKQSEYIVQEGDTVEQIAFNNQIGVNEFLISNPDFTSENNLLYTGQKVIIGETSPKVNVVIQEYIEELQSTKYKTEIKYDNTRVVGDDEVLQAGEYGAEKVTQRIKKINGIITNTETIEKTELKPAINEIIVRGGKIVPNVGDLKIWAWPTISGYVITSNYEYRIHPITKRRELHDALDIAGCGHGSPIYSANNGNIESVNYGHSTLGNYIVVNHNNGYYTLYAHLSKITVREGQLVSRGQKIGEMGRTGRTTGTHLHFELWKGGRPWGGGTNINPWTVYRK